MAICVCLLAAGANGCSTTQDKAAAKQAEAAKILKARAERQKAKRREKAGRREHHHGNGKSKGDK